MEAEGLRSLFPDQRHRGDGNPAGARSPADAPRAHPADGGSDHRRADRTRSSSSTAPTSPIASRAACAGRCRTCRSSTTSARASGPGGRGGRKRCAPMSIACSACLPFEPEAYVRLGGPRCVYVGHPLIERLGELRPNEDEARRRDAEPPIVVVLPGSRRSEIRRLMDDFGGALQLLREAIGPFVAVLPTLPHIEAEVRGARRALAAGAEDRARGSAEIRRVSPRARSARRVRHRHARARPGRACRWSAPTRWGWSKSSSSISSRSPRFSSPISSSATGRSRRSCRSDCNPDALGAALTAVARDGPARAGADRGAGASRLAACGSESDEAPSAHAARAVLETIAIRRPP